ncbi:hypothetical protein ACU635_33750 [[Actinomadura] parvosata]|uniref:hypothetical protein n=1 Tax=[Actinomadura] parvosata TaxID=1955412 RepID=UPI00406CBA3B
MSHSRAAPSLSPLAKRLPSEVKLTEVSARWTSPRTGGARGVDGGQGDDKALGWRHCHSRDRSDLCVSHGLMAICQLALDDIDLPGRRIRLGGHPRKLSEFAHRALVDWLKYRHHTWPHTPNRHVLVSWESAVGTEPVSRYYLTWWLSLLGVQLEQIRGDRVLWLTCRGGQIIPRHLGQGHALLGQW